MNGNLFRYGLWNKSTEGWIKLGAFPTRKEAETKRNELAGEYPKLLTGHWEIRNEGQGEIMKFCKDCKWYSKVPLLPELPVNHTHNQGQASNAYLHSCMEERAKPYRNLIAGDYPKCETMRRGVFPLHCGHHARWFEPKDKED